MRSAGFADLIDFVAPPSGRRTLSWIWARQAALAKSRGVVARGHRGRERGRARLFANFVNGVEVLKQVFMQLLLYYTRFRDGRKNGGARALRRTSCRLRRSRTGPLRRLEQALAVSSEGPRAESAGSADDGQVARSAAWPASGDTERSVACSAMGDTRAAAASTATARAEDERSKPTATVDHHRRPRRRFGGCDELRLTGRSQTRVGRARPRAVAPRRPHSVEERGVRQRAVVGPGEG